jgi:hypothetical protein
MKLLTTDVCREVFIDTTLHHSISSNGQDYGTPDHSIIAEV